MQDTMNAISRSNKIVLYTSIIGNYDAPVEQPEWVKQSGMDAVMFTDQDFKLSTWNIVKVQPFDEKDPSRSSRIYKMLPHRFFPAHKYSLWINGNMLLTQHPSKYFDTLETRMDKTIWDGNDHVQRIPMIVYPPVKSIPKTDVYDEIMHCIKLRKDDPIVLAKQALKYRAEGLPKDSGLYSGGVIFRMHHHQDVIKVGEMWWNELKQESRRDQASLPYVMWKLKCRPFFFFQFGTDERPLVKMVDRHIKR